MAQENQWLLDVLGGMLPEQTVQVLQDHVLDPETPFQILLRQLSLRVQKAFNMLIPVVTPLFNRALEALNNSPDVVIVAVMLSFVIVALQFVFWMQRIMMFWTRLAMRMVFYAALAAVVAVVWQRGPEAAMADVAHLAAKIATYAAIVKNFWLSEYYRYEAQTKNGGSAGAAKRGSR
jgi:hypothetical protein